jgi:rfaE bifunctional protein nucleotidyltransferase chain/domain
MQGKVTPLAAVGEDHVPIPNETIQRKIVSLPDMDAVCTRLRKQGRTIVLCHGVFDLVHVGHLRHLKAAREFGDVLVISITADEYVNKGPDRPAFTAELRTEFLASLELVDFVTVVHENSAAPALRAVKPHFYVKGDEYAAHENDITGKIVYERELVESFGGQLVFTHDVTFSSSNLLNKHFPLHDEATKEYLDTLRQSGFGKKISQLLGRAADLRVVIVGEAVIDRYVYVAPLGKSAKESIIAALQKGEEMFAGGAVAAANHLAAICKDVELISLVGDPRIGETHEEFLRERLDPSVKVTFVHRPEGPTVQKTRFVEPTYVRKLFEIYQMDDRSLPDDVQDEFHAALRSKIKDADLVIVCDFGHGMISQRTIDILEKESRFLAVNAQSNAGNVGYNLIHKYTRADFICIDQMEGWLAVRDRHADTADVAGRLLPEMMDCPNIIVTAGKAGCFVRERDGRVVKIPSFGNGAVDTIGAGDAFFVIAAPMLAAGADCETAGFMGNVAGAITIGIVGHRRYLTKLEIQRYVMTLLK